MSAVLPRIMDISYKTKARPSAMTQQQFHARFVLSCSTSTGLSLSNYKKKWFTQLANRWEKDNHYSSSISIRIQHQDCLDIMEMGKEVISLILERMKTNPGMWFTVLQILANCDPVKQSTCGNIHAMTDDWLNWGEQHGYC